MIELINEYAPEHLILSISSLLTSFMSIFFDSYDRLFTTIRDHLSCKEIFHQQLILPFHFYTSLVLLTPCCFAAHTRHTPNVPPFSIITVLRSVLLKLV